MLILACLVWEDKSPYRIRHQRYNQTQVRTSWIYYVLTAIDMQEAVKVIRGKITEYSLETNSMEEKKGREKKSIKTHSSVREARSKQTETLNRTNPKKSKRFG